jgi:shikimate dehydrogenase
MVLTGDTRVVGLFGDPIEHSLSPVMQNAAIQAAAINAVYVPFHVTPQDLKPAIDSIRRLGLVGINLTIPHKIAALSLVDELDTAARVIGSINTIVNRDGKLTGYNTDGPGVCRVLREELDVDLAGQRILLLGAGGAGRAVAVSAGLAGAAWIGVANRTYERASRLVSDVSSMVKGTTFASLSLDADLPRHLPDRVDILINATAIGLKGERHPFPVLDCVRSGGAVYDAVYGRQPTPLVQEALSAGFRAADGLAMLAAQGELAFKYWFGQEPPAGIMKTALKEMRRG